VNVVCFHVIRVQPLFCNDNTTVISFAKEHMFSTWFVFVVGLSVSSITQQFTIYFC